MKYDELIENLCNSLLGKLGLIWKSYLDGSISREQFAKLCDLVDYVACSLGNCIEDIPDEE